ncbi:hypothetical protein [Acetivibrio cellulolyticus]|nr:hypothetical protein [Acetivibrio cellulolyticus]
MKLLEKYQAEHKALLFEVNSLETKLNAVQKDEQDVEEFIKRLKSF